MTNTTYTRQSIRTVDLKPGMRTALHQADGTIAPYATIAGIEADDYDGSITVTFTDGRREVESYERIANGSTYEIAVAA